MTVQFSNEKKGKKKKSAYPSLVFSVRVKSFIKFLLMKLRCNFFSPGMEALMDRRFNQKLSLVLIIMC